MHIKCLSVTKCQQLSDTSNSQSSTYEVHGYLNYINDMQQLFIADVLLWKLVNKYKVVSKQQSGRRRYLNKYPSELNTSYLVELLQNAAVEHLISVRCLQARDFDSVGTIVTTDFEAMSAYKRGDYQQCLQLSTQNVLLCARLSDIDMPTVTTFPQFIQLLDDDIVSLTAVMLIANANCRLHSFNFCISQMTLSLYLMTQCQLKLRHSVTSLAQTLDCIKIVHRRHQVVDTLNRLILKMIAHKVRKYIATMMNEVFNLAYNKTARKGLSKTLIGSSKRKMQHNENRNS